MRRFFALALCAATLLSLTACSFRKSETSVSAELFAMDTVMNFTASGDGAQTALDACQEQITNLEALLSRTKEESEVSRINAAGTAGAVVSPSVEQLLSAAIDYSAATSGAFDITIAPVVTAWGFTTDSYQIPSQQELDTLLALVDYRKIILTNPADGSGYHVCLGAGQSIDLGGIAKGYASDCVKRIFGENGVASGMASLGGNVYVCGAKPDGSDWRVAVQDPNDTAGYVGVLKLQDAFAVTSGGYQRYFEEGGKRYHHIIDPATGYPAESGLVSVTVVASANEADADAATGVGTMCDAFSTALFVMGEEQALEFRRTGGYDFDLVLVTDDGRVLITDGIAGQFEQSEDNSYAYEVVS